MGTTTRRIHPRSARRILFVAASRSARGKMIRIGDLVRGRYFHRKIGVVVKIDPVAEMAFVKFTDTKQIWEPLANIRKATK